MALANDSIESDVLDDLGSLFYLVRPRKHTFESVDECPDHVEKALPYMVAFIVLETIINVFLQGKKMNLADSITNINCGVLMVFGQLVSKVAMVSTYSWLYQHYRILDIGWDSAVFWILAAAGVDLGYYFFHRASHEVGFLWAVHQIHHSSEELNLTTAFRQPFLEGLGWLTHWFYLPCSLFLPPQQMLVHSELNFLYQFWIHTEMVGNLGPLELIFNTASQHRVHHGANRYCIDKNYGGVLSIWDRIFGTFAEEKKDEDLVYGLVDQPQFFNILKHNYFYFGLLHEKAKSFGSWKAWFYGPGWFPGLPRLGDVSGLPEIPKREKHYSSAGWSTYIVVLLNTIISVIILDCVSSSFKTLPWTSLVCQAVIVFFAAYSSGLMLDGEKSTLQVDSVRLMLTILSAVRVQVLPDSVSQMSVAVSVISLAHNFISNKING